MKIKGRFISMTGGGSKEGLAHSAEIDISAEELASQMTLDEMTLLLQCKPKEPQYCEIKGDSELWALIVNYFPAFGGEEVAQNKRSLFEQVSKLIDKRCGKPIKPTCEPEGEIVIDGKKITDMIKELESWIK